MDLFKDKLVRVLEEKEREEEKPKTWKFLNRKTLDRETAELCTADAQFHIEHLA